MRRPHLLVPLLLLTVAAGGFLLLLSQDDETGLPPAAAASRAQEGKPRRAASAATLPTGSTEGSNGSTRNLVANDAPETRAHPADATWMEVLVLDPSGDFVAGAEVCWHDPEAFELNFRDRSRHWQEKSMLWTQPDMLARRHGWRTVSDARGRARITAGVDFVVTGCARGPSGQSLFGELRLAAGLLNKSDTHRLVLYPDQTLQVVVVDIQGRPCRGVPLTLTTADRYGHHCSALQFDEFAITDAHGRASLLHVQRYREAIEADPNYDQSDLKTHVHALLPGNDEPGVAIDLHNLPTDSVTVRLPPCGKVRMRAVIDGISSASTLDLFLSCPEQERFETSSSLLPGPDGWATFEHVPVGQSLTGSSLAVFGVTARFEGPRFAGDVVEVIVEPAQDEAWLATRLLNPAGKPIRNGWFRLYDQTTGRQVGEPFGSDDEGNARILIPKKPGEPIAAVPASWIRSPDVQSNWGRGKLKVQRIATGVTDIGDTTFERGKLIVSGRLMIGDKPFTKHCFLNLERFDARAKPDDSWQNVREASCHLLTQGQFTVHSTNPKGQLRLVVDVPDALPIKPIPIQATETDLVVQVDPGHTLAVGMLVPRGCELKNLRVQLTSTGVSGQGQEIGQRFHSEPTRTQGERCIATWPSLPADTYTLTLSIWAQPNHLVQIRDIVLPLPAPNDARLDEIDLRELVQVATIHCLDQDGQRIDDDGALFPRGQLIGGKRHGYTLYGASTRMLLPRGPVDLTALFADRQPTPVRGPGPVFSIHCLPWPRLQVRLPDPPNMPAGAEFSIGLRPVTPPPATWNDGEYQQPFAALISIDEDEWGKPGEVVAPLIAEGHHGLRLWLHANRQKIRIHGITPSRVLASDHAIAIRIPAAPWRAALSQIHKPPK